MKTDISDTRVHDMMLAKMEALFQHVPSETIIAQLQLAVERITFAGVVRADGDNNHKYALSKELIEDEVSPAMLSFLRVVITNGHLEAISGENGRQFIGHCIRYYADSTEAIFISAIPLDQDFQQVIARKLKAQFSPQTKIVFRVSPTLVAGFVIKVGNDKHDYSLGTSMRASLRSYAQKVFVDGIRSAARG
jgi:F0F1-type ATP synthase delta subunit